MRLATDKRARRLRILIGLNTAPWKTERAEIVNHPTTMRIMPLSKIFRLVFLGILIFVRDGFALGQVQYVENVSGKGSFPIVEKNLAANIYADTNDLVGVIRAASDLQTDIARVTGLSPTITHEENKLGKNIIVIGTIRKSQVIAQLIREKKIDVSEITGKWESFLIQVVPKPLPGVASALVICGSDKRGTIYGIYDLSEEMGVSPWYWWADVPVQHKDS